MKKLYIFITNNLRVWLNLRQKFFLFSILKWFSHLNIYSLLSPSGYEKYRVLQEAFSVLRPFSTQYDEMRVGSDGDGGYVLPRINHEWDVLVSPGVGSSSMFEMSVATAKTRVVLIDGNVPRPSGLPENFEFINKLLGEDNSESTVTLDSIVVKYCRHGQWAMLQMDIEGGEWLVLNQATSEDLQKFQIIILELHNLENLVRDEFGESYTNVLSKLSSSHFCSHFHVNNAGGFFFYRGKRFPRVVEVTMLNLHFFTQTKKSTDSANLDSASDPEIFDWKFKF